MSWVRKRDEKTEHGYVEERLSAYLDGELTQQERSIVERHLAVCQDCRWNLDTLRQTVRWVQELPSVSVPRVFTIPVPAEPVRAPRRRWGVPLLQGATALVALMLVFVVAGDFVWNGSWLPAAGEVGLSSVAPGSSEVAPTLAAEADTALQPVVETLEVEAPMQVVVEAETVVEEVVGEQAASAETGVEAIASEAAATESSPPEAEVGESPPVEPTEPPVAATVPSILERSPDVRSAPEAPAGGGETIVETPITVEKTGGEEIATVTAEPSSTPVPEPTMVPTETSTPLPAPTAIPTVTPSPAQPLAAEAPTTVAMASPEELQEGARATEWVAPTSAAPGDEGEGDRLPRHRLIVWFGVAEISLAAVFVLLATVTIVVMIRQRRTH
jgi:anti-sigma factor RsiW